MGVSPMYTIHRYTDHIYKIIAWKGFRDLTAIHIRDRENEHRNETKLDSNLSRARSMVLQYALCNPWEYFFTGTLDRNKWQRDDLDRFMRDFQQKIRDWRKEYGFKLDVLLVPERHKDGMWHVHGLINNLPYFYTGGFYWLPLPSLHMTPYPWKLCQGDFRSWMDFQDRYGYCSLSPIRDPVATAYYVTKYIGKDIGSRSGDFGTYSHIVAQDRRDVLASHKGAPLKIEGNALLIAFLEERIMLHRDSPAAVSARLRTSSLPYLSEATIYRYAHQKRLPGLRKWHLPEKGIRKHPYQPLVRSVKQPRYGASIELRPAEIAERSTFGHWEMDCVVGKNSGTDQACLVFTERLTRLELIFKLHTKDAASVVAVLDRLQRSCNFRRIFKSITCDNGSEFANTKRLEFSAKGRLRTRVYYCHPYTSCERASNENANRLIRRWFKKGKSMKNVTPAQATQVAVWMNTYPREILGWKTPAEAFRSACAAEGIKISKYLSQYLS